MSFYEVSRQGRIGGISEFEKLENLREKVEKGLERHKNRYLKKNIGKNQIFHTGKIDFLQFQKKIKNFYF